MKTIDIYITELCNLDCEYCYVEIKKNEVDSIDGTEFTQRINLLEYDLIKFYGGEPLLKWKDIKDIISSVFQKNKAIRFSIITNGLLLTAEKLDFLKAHNSSVALSLHENSLKKTLSTHFLKAIFPYKNIIGFIILFSYKKPEL